MYKRTTPNDGRNMASAEKLNLRMTPKLTPNNSVEGTPSKLGSFASLTAPHVKR